ncbi:MAG: DUF421 domain-containing protein [Clostridia bacterium]|nr:DUF421 domain-containing protein [Clostridia bacterium]
MSNTILDSILYTILAYFMALTVARIVGRKMISQMTFFDYIIGVTLGSVTANFALVSQIPISSAITVLITLGVLTLTLDYAHIKSLFIRKAIDSEPTVLVENGKIVNQNMSRTRFTINELLMQLREKNVFNIADVEFAVLETDGNLSVLPKSQKAPLTPSDLNISTKYKGLTKDLVIDGNIMSENLKDINLDENWLRDSLKGHGITNIREVFYAGLDSSGNLFVSKRQDTREKHGQYGME